MSICAADSGTIIHRSVTLRMQEANTILSWRGLNIKKKQADNHSLIIDKLTVAYRAPVPIAPASAGCECTTQTYRIPAFIKLDPRVGHTWVMGGPISGSNSDQLLAAILLVHSVTTLF